MGDLRKGLITDHPSGLEFIGAKVGAGIPWGKRCFGALLNNPEFTDLAGLGRSLDRLERVETQNIALAGRRLIPNYKAIVGKRTGKAYAIVSDIYDPVQDEDVVRPFFDAAQARGLEPVGRLDGIGTGRTVGHVVLANPEFRIRLLEEYDDDVLLGVRFWNSYGHDTSFGAEVFGIRTVCVNYNLWGRIVGKYRRIHIGVSEATQRAYEDLIDKALDASKILRGLASTALEIVVERPQVVDAFWGLSMGPRQVEQLDTTLETWSPEIKELGLNAWTLYNAVTAYATYREQGGTYIEATERLTRKANDLLTKNVEEIIEKGRNRRKAHEEKLERKAAEREERKAKAKTEAV